MKKILALVLALLMIAALAACGGSKTDTAEAPAAEAPAAEPAEAPADTAESFTATFSTGETFPFEGDTFTFFFQCDAPADMGAPNDGEEGAGITASEGAVSYSEVTLGGPFQYPTAELVTISGVTGDITIEVTEAVTSMGEGLYHIYTTQQEIDDAIAFNEKMAAEMAANPMPASGEPSGEPTEETEASDEPSGEPSGGNAEMDFDIELDGKTVSAHYADVDDGNQMTKSFEITVNDQVIAGHIDKGVWTADSGDDADQAIVDLVHAAFEGK